MTSKGQVVIARALQQLVDDPERHELLLQLATIAASVGRTTLLLVPRVEQAQQLAAHLRARGVSAADATSATGKEARASQLRQLRARQLQVLVATQLADEGLDVPVLDCVIVASTGRAAGRAVQRIGRVMRTADGKAQPVVVDVVDPTPFRGQWRAREQAYRDALGLQVPAPVARNNGPDALRRALGW
jgi:superfamily II DNA or RNA helicase